MEVIEAKNYGYNFIPQEYLPKGKDEYWVRNIQAASLLEPTTWRKLTTEEITALEKNNCRSGNWNDVLVADPFDSSLIRNTSFYGLVRLGKIENKLLKYHDFCVPVGIRNSTIVSCDIGDDVSIQDCSLISHYIIAHRCILSRVDEMVTSNHSKFGNGIIKQGESEDVRVWIDVMNEAGGRSILPFVQMIPADAYLWAAWRDDTQLVEKLKDITQETQSFLYCAEHSANKQSAQQSCNTQQNYASHIPSSQRGFYGTIGQQTVIKSCRIIKDTAIGPYAYIKGANKLKNLSILSSKEECAQIGEGVELVNGIIGYGCHVFYGAKAVRFVLGSRCGLKYGARLIHSVLGDNSTVSCCEILNNLIFPVHEQHHNTSFLIASLVEGMSNMAAGATIGSNHNSRSNDGEIRAGRGFWPGLSVTLKHSSRFASFCLISKGDYPYELNIPFPFALVNNNVSQNRLEVMPAYFWTHNLYALERNSWKTINRDKRVNKVQRIEADYLAPDTAEEIINALGLIESWMAAAGMNEDDPLPAYGLERHSRSAVILKPRRAAAAYREMLFYYGIKTIVSYLEDCAKENIAFDKAIAKLKGPRVNEWVNMGGQIVPAFRIDLLQEDIRCGKIKTWDQIHERYNEMASAYRMDKAAHAWAVLAFVYGNENELEHKAHPLADREAFKVALQETARISEWIKDQVKISRAKDYDDPFRCITYRNKSEMEQVAGKIEDNSFIKLIEESHQAFVERIKALV